MMTMPKGCCLMTDGKLVCDVVACCLLPNGQMAYCCADGSCLTIDMCCMDKAGNVMEGMPCMMDGES